MSTEDLSEMGRGNAHRLSHARYEDLLAAFESGLMRAGYRPVANGDKRIWQAPAARIDYGAADRVGVCPMDKDAEVSLHRVRIMRVFADNSWLTNEEVAKRAGVARRTARHQTKRLTSLGILEQKELYPGHRFRLSPNAEKINPFYLQRLQEAERVFRSQGL